MVRDRPLLGVIKFVINGEAVSISVSEAKDEVKHVLTKEENMQLLKYEDEKRRHSWASKPNIRKYDYLYNNRITLTINNSKKFRDNKSYVVEDRLGDIMIKLYEASDVIRKERKAREEAERNRQEEERRKEERRECYNAEVDRTLSLVNLSDDYEVACKLSAMSWQLRSPDISTTRQWLGLNGQRPKQTGTTRL